MDAQQWCKPSIQEPNEWSLEQPKNQKAMQHCSLGVPGGLVALISTPSAI
jgi:hypothetical protein